MRQTHIHGISGRFGKIHPIIRSRGNDRSGTTTGPYSKADLGRMAGKGAFKRDTYVWTAGQDGWQRAEDVQELTQLFTILPPSPPPPAE